MITPSRCQSRQSPEARPFVQAAFDRPRQHECSTREQAEAIPSVLEKQNPLETAHGERKNVTSHILAGEKFPEDGLEQPSDQLRNQPRFDPGTRRLAFILNS